MSTNRHALKAAASALKQIKKARPQITVQKVDAPRIDLPQIEFPRIEFPQIDFSLVQLPQVDVPTFLIPTIPQTTLEALEAVVLSVHAASDLVLKSFNRFEQELLEYEDQARALGRCGWTLPLNMEAAAIPDLLEGIEPDTDYDAAFEDMYVVNDGAAFRELRRDLEENKLLAPWRSLIAECADSYVEGRFRVAVPALLIIFEGALASATNSILRMKDPKALSASRRRAAKTGIDLLVWASLEGFTAELFRDHRFSDPEPIRVNRHWVLHGRSLSEWSRADVLRLFQAIHTVA